MLFSILSLASNNLLLFYTDPGSGALLLQLLIASLLGGLFYLRRAKDKITKLLFKKSAAGEETSYLPEETK
jgi:hypothetical protein